MEPRFLAASLHYDKCPLIEERYHIRCPCFGASWRDSIFLPVPKTDENDADVAAIVALLNKIADRNKT